MYLKTIYLQHIRLLLIFILLFTVEAISKVEFSSLNLKNNFKSQKMRVTKNFKAGTDVVTLGDYIWFDYNQNGLQDRGEAGLYDVKVKLYSTKDCTGVILQETISSNLGYYEFRNIPKSTNPYCIAVEYPSFWKATPINQGEGSLNSKLIHINDSLGRIENILLAQDNQDLDIGLHHKESGCQKPSLNVGVIGTYDNRETWATKSWLDVKFNNIVAHGYCHEYNNRGPNRGDIFSAHLEDRLGFSSQQKEKLSRLFRWMNDKEVMRQLTQTFIKTDTHIWTDQFSNMLVWYVTDWNSSMERIDLFIDENDWFQSLSLLEKTSLKSIAQFIVNKIEGLNGASQYAPMKVYYLWNQTNDKRQDIIVPETLLIPDRKACLDTPNPLLKTTLGDKVWFDADKNGKQDLGEQGLKGITVELYDANDKLLSSTITNDKGFYRFIELESGEYRVKFIKKEGFSFSKKQSNGVETSLNSDADLVTGFSDAIILESENLTIDAGMYITPQPRISIEVQTNGGDVSNIIVGDTITWTYIIRNTGNEALSSLVLIDNQVGAVTDCVGEGSLDLLTPNRTLTCTKVGTATLGLYSNSATVDAKDLREAVVTSTGNSSYVGRETVAKTGSIGDYVWLDSNRDGKQSNGELPLNGVAVKLYTKDGQEYKSTTTDALGHYLFTDVIVGSYYIQFIVPSGYTVTVKDKDNDGQDSDTDSNGKTDTFLLEEGQNLITLDMGIYPTVVNLGDRVWNDINGNGLQEDGEKGISSVAVVLYKASGLKISETKTNSVGKYEFRNLIGGNYYVVFSIPNGYKVSPKNQGNNESEDSDVDTLTGKTDIIVLKAGINNPTVDMGLFRESAKVGDRVWYDSNKNGLQDNGEQGIANVDVALYHVGESSAVATTKTSANGIYLFDNIVAGEYYIVFTAPLAYTITGRGKGAEDKDSDADKDGRTANFTLANGTQNSSIDMGLYQDVVSIGDRVWLDINNNGLQDNGESGVRDINVTVQSANSDFSKTMQTDENGNYLFTHLSAGEYSLEFSNIPYGHLITKKDVNGNDNEDKDSDVFENNEKKFVTEITLLTPSENDLSWDMGIYKTVCLPGKAVLGNLVWEDFNKDGIQDIGERGIENISVTLFNNDTDEEVATVKTDENGLYEFAHIDPNFNYYIQFQVPDGYVVSPQDQDDEVLDSDADETGKTEVITVEADKINSSIDMGLYHQGSTLGDRVWFDEAGGVSNGIQDLGEQGVFDVKVTLYSTDGSEVQRTRTNVSGEYHFTNVLQGRYVIGFSNLPNGYLFSPENQGVDDTLDSDVNSNGKTTTIVVNASSNIAHIDAGLRKIHGGNSSHDLQRGVTGQNVVIDVLANDIEGSFRFVPSTVRITSTPQGATLSADGKRLIVPSEGVWSVDADSGVITFEPNEGFVGDPTGISYSVEDTQGNETGADVEVDYPPVANRDLVNGSVGKQIIVYVLDNDNATSSPLDQSSVRIINPKNGNRVETLVVVDEGVWSVNSNGSITFTPDNGFSDNPIPIEYIVRELEGDESNRATVTIIYPDAVDDIYIIPVGEEGSVTINVSENDSDLTLAETISLGCKGKNVHSLTITSEGVWSVIDDGLVRFTPESGFVGEPTDIQYRVELSSGGLSNCATIDIRQELLLIDDLSTLNVGGITRINVLINDYGNFNIDSLRLVMPINIPQGSTLSNDGQVLTVPNEGVWTIDNRGIIIFTAEDGFTGIPTPINYNIENRDGVRSNDATITLTEGAVSLTANDDEAPANGGATIMIDVLLNDIGDINRSSVVIIDNNGEPTRTLIVSGEGTWQVHADGSITFTGEDGFVGTPTPIEYQIEDNTALLTDTAGVEISGICDCTVYDDAVPSIGYASGVLLILFTLFYSMFLLREERY